MERLIQVMNEWLEKVKFNKGAWLSFTFALVLVLLSMAQVAYRFTLPTDGWSVHTTELEKSDWIYDTNLVGAPSGLELNDLLLSVEDVSMRGTASIDYVPPPAGWQAGRSVNMIIERFGQTLSIKVPVVNWIGQVLWTYNTTQIDQAFNTLGAFILMIIGWFTFFRRPDGDGTGYHTASKGIVVVQRTDE
jgi:hypothetical protein